MTTAAQQDNVYFKYSPASNAFPFASYYPSQLWHQNCLFPPATRFLCCKPHPLAFPYYNLLLSSSLSLEEGNVPICTSVNEHVFWMPDKKKQNNRKSHRVYILEGSHSKCKNQATIPFFFAFSVSGFCYEQSQVFKRNLSKRHSIPQPPPGYFLLSLLTHKSHHHLNHSA